MESIFCSRRRSSTISSRAGHVSCHQSIRKLDGIVAKTGAHKPVVGEIIFRLQEPGCPLVQSERQRKELSLWHENSEAYARTAAFGDKHASYSRWRRLYGFVGRLGSNSGVRSRISSGPWVSCHQYCCWTSGGSRVPRLAPAASLGCGSSLDLDEGRNSQREIEERAKLNHRIAALCSDHSVSQLTRRSPVVSGRLID